MKARRLSQWKVILLGLTITATVTLADARKAHACYDPYCAAVVLGILATYTTVRTAICAPVAAIKARNHAEGFTGAFKDCWRWNRSTEPATPARDAESAESIVNEQSEPSDHQDLLQD